MANETIQLRAKAKTLGIDGYRAMSTEELKKAIKSAEKGTASSKVEQPSTNGASATGSKRKGAAKKGTARKTADKSSSKKKTPAKTTTRKSSAKSAPAAPAKRSASGAGKKKSSTAKTTTAAKSGQPGRVQIVNAEIDWSAPSKIGQSGGNRQTIMKLLRSKKGNVAKVFDALADNAQSMYGKTDDGKRRTKGDAQALLRWHISRIKFDFVKDTGQHEGVTRSQSGRKTSTGSKSKAKTATAQKGAQSRTKAKAKTTPKRSTAKAKSATRKTGKAATSRKRSR